MVKQYHSMGIKEARDQVIQKNMEKSGRIDDIIAELNTLDKPQDD